MKTRQINLWTRFPLCFTLMQYFLFWVGFYAIIVADETVLCGLRWQLSKKFSAKKCLAAYWFSQRNENYPIGIEFAEYW